MCVCLSISEIYPKHFNNKTIIAITFFLGYKASYFLRHLCLFISFKMYLCIYIMFPKRLEIISLMVAEVDLNERSVPSLETGILNLLSFLYL